MKKLVTVNNLCPFDRDRRKFTKPVFVELECATDGEVLDSLENYRLLDEAYERYNE